MCTRLKCRLVSKQNKQSPKSNKPILSDHHDLRNLSLVRLFLRKKTCIDQTVPIYLNAISFKIQAFVPISTTFALFVSWPALFASILIYNNNNNTTDPVSFIGCQKYVGQTFIQSKRSGQLGRDPSCWREIARADDTAWRMPLFWKITQDSIIIFVVS